MSDSDKTDYYERSMILHRHLRGKISVNRKAPVLDKEDLSVVYSPGVAQPCRAIAEDPSQAMELTVKRNSVAVVSDGSAVLGLGNIGPLAAIPVMEGKALLFREFAGINAWPICLDTQDTDKMIETVKQIAPVFGGINLEDIAAPRCFEVEAALQDLGIPVFHDDQHGTAIVLLAALINSSIVTGKPLSEMRAVINGAGAAGVAIAKLINAEELREVPLPYAIKQQLGELSPVKEIIMCDSKGAIHKGRDNLSPLKESLLEFTNSSNTQGNIKEVIKDCDVFIGVSKGGLLDADDIRNMNEKPLVFAMANPEPEIMPEEAYKGGAAIVGTGRSDFPNQVNNLLAFPGIFRGALDIQAKRITLKMKLAAAIRLASCVDTPTADKILPNPLDKTVAPAIAISVAENAEK